MEKEIKFKWYKKLAAMILGWNPMRLYQDEYMQFENWNMILDLSDIYEKQLMGNKLSDTDIHRKETILAIARREKQLHEYQLRALFK